MNNLSKPTLPSLPSDTEQADPSSPSLSVPEKFLRVKPARSSIFSRWTLEDASRRIQSDVEMRLARRFLLEACRSINSDGHRGGASEPMCQSWIE